MRLKVKSEVLTQAGNVVLNTSKDTLGASLNFDVARNYRDENFATCEKLEIGDEVVLESEKLLFQGVILSITASRFVKNVKCLDFCFYLNKNKVLKQFEGIAAKAALEELLTEAGAPIGSIAAMATSISKIYNGNTVAEVIDDILQQVSHETGIKHVIEFREGKFYIEPYKKIEVKFRATTKMNVSTSESMANMKNSVVVSSNEQETCKVLATAEDSGSIDKFGKLQEVLSVDPSEDAAKVRNIASMKLKELNKVAKTASLTGFGDDEFRATRVVSLNLPENNLVGDYVINSCSHTWKNGEHLVELEVEENGEE